MLSTKKRQTSSSGDVTDETAVVCEGKLEDHVIGFFSNFALAKQLRTSVSPSGSDFLPLSPLKFEVRLGIPLSSRILTIRKLVTASQSASFSTKIWAGVQSLSLFDTIQYLHRRSSLLDPKN